MQHIKEEHHKINIETAKKLFEELWEFQNEQLNDTDFNTWGEHGETPHYENAEKVSKKNVRSTSDITSHKYVDIANTDAYDSEVHTNITNAIIAHLGLEDNQAVDVTISAASIKTPKYPSIKWVVYKAAATGIPVEDANYPKAINVLTKADFANLEDSLGFTAYQSNLEVNDDQSTTKFIPDAISDASAGDFESCDHTIAPEVDQILAETVNAEKDDVGCAMLEVMLY